VVSANLKNLKQSLFDIALLFVSFSVALNVRRLFNSKPSEYFGIETTSGMQPESNYLAILSIILVTICLFWILKNIQKKYSVLFRISIISILAISFLIGGIAPSIARYENNVDTFHHGEQLAPALAFENGKKPYVDLFILRGAGEDVIAPWLSFKAFGTSIGSYYLLTGILKLISLALFYIFLSTLFKDNFDFLITSLWFSLTIYGAFFYARDIFVWLSLILFASIIYSNKLTPHKLLPMGTLASLSLFYSFDRGIFLTALFAGVCLLLFLLENQKEFFVFRRDKISKRVRKIVPGIIGYFIGLLSMFILLGAEGIASFYTSTFNEAAKYQGLIFNTPYPLFSSQDLIYWLPILAIIVLVIEIIKTLKREWPKIHKQTVIELVLLLFGVIFFRAATGRPDIGHIAYGTPILFVLLFYVSLRRIDHSYSSKKDSIVSTLSSSAALFIVLAISMSTTVVNYYKLGQMNQVPLNNLKTFLTAPSKPDSFWLTNDTELISEFIKERTSDNDYFFVLSSDPLFYYTTMLKNPTRYSISWFADPDVLEAEMLDDLVKNPPKIVLYESGTPYDRPDSFSMKDRLPRVNEWLIQNYSDPVIVDGTKAKVLFKER
jgi:hypothetical protein